MTPSATVEVFRLDAEALGRLLEQRAARGRRRLADLHAADLDREAAPGRALVGRQRGVALDDLDARERHVELVGGDLRERRRDAGAEIDLAGVDRDHAVGVDGEDRNRPRSARAALRRRALRDAPIAAGEARS